MNEALPRVPRRVRIDDHGRFEGYASLFGIADMSGDSVVAGAFRRSLERRGAAGIRMLFQHDPNTPIGVWNSVYETRKGLYAKGRLTLDVVKAREVLALLRAGGLDGLSIGFRTITAKRSSATGIRRLLAIDLWEISVVTFPMLPEARVASVDPGGADNVATSPLARTLRRATEALRTQTELR